MSTHNLCFEQKYEKYQNFLSENFHFFFGGKIFCIFEYACFLNVENDVSSLVEINPLKPMKFDCKLSLETYEIWL